MIHAIRPMPAPYQRRPRSLVAAETGSVAMKNAASIVAPAERLQQRSECDAGIERMRDEGRHQQAGQHGHRDVPAHDPARQQVEAACERREVDPGEAARAERLRRCRRVASSSGSV